LQCNHCLPLPLQPEGATASITFRNLDDDIKRRLRVRAAEHGRSMEEEARDILRQVVGQPGAPRNLGQPIHARFAALGGVDLPPAKRQPMRPAPDLE
jgi:plasmid stability protein